jgi:hypothetical protein
MVCWLFFNFAAVIWLGCCSLAQEMSFVDHYLLYFRKQLITGTLSALLPFQPLFTESSHRDQLLALSPFSSALCPLYCVLVFSSLFIVQFFVLFCFCFCLFVGQVISLPRGLCWFIPGCLGEAHMTLGAHLLVCQMSPKQVWSWHLAVQKHSYLLSVMWHGEALCGLGVQGVKVLILLGALFLPSVAPVSSKIFDLRSSCCLLLHPSRHLRSSSGSHLELVLDNSHQDIRSIFPTTLVCGRHCAEQKLRCVHVNTDLKGTLLSFRIFPLLRKY